MISIRIQNSSHQESRNKPPLFNLELGFALPCIFVLNYLSLLASRVDQISNPHCRIYTGTTVSVIHARDFVSVRQCLVLWLRQKCGAANSSQGTKWGVLQDWEYFQKMNLHTLLCSVISCSRFHEFWLELGEPGAAALPSLREQHKRGSPIPPWEIYLPPGWTSCRPCLD